MFCQSRAIIRIVLILIVTFVVAGFGLAIVEAAPGLNLSIGQNPLLTGNPVIIQGTAIMENGQAIPDLQVAIQIASASGIDFVDQVATNANGQFQLQAIPMNPRAGEYTVTAAPQGLNIVTIKFNYVDTLGGGGGNLPALPGPVPQPQPVTVFKLDPAWAQQLGSGPVATVNVQPGQQTMLEAAIATQLAGTGKSLAVASGAARLMLPATSLSGLTGGSLQIGINNPDPSQGTESETAAESQQLTTIGSDVEIEAWTVTNSGDVAWSGRSQLSLGINNQQLEDPARAEKLGIYRWQPQDKQWRYVGGKIDLQSGTIAVWLNGFSRYAVLESTKTFTDIISHWARRDVEVMAARQVARGVTADQFAPDRTINRAEFTALLVRSLGIKATSQQQLPFNDVAANSWYYSEVAAAYQAGLVSGIGAAAFEPDAAITREQLAVMLIRAARVAGITVNQVNEELALNGFKDRSAIANWAQPEVAAAASLGLVKGTPEGDFLPGNHATRAEAITTLRRWSDLR